MIYIIIVLVGIIITLIAYILSKSISTNNYLSLKANDEFDMTHFEDSGDIYRYQVVEVCDTECVVKLKTHHDIGYNKFFSWNRFSRLGYFKKIDNE